MGVLQYAHNMCGALVTGAFVMAAVGAYYLLERTLADHARIFVRVGVVAGPAGVACCRSSRPAIVHGKLRGEASAGDARRHGRTVHDRRRGAPMVLIGQPDPEKQRIDNPLSGQPAC